MKKKGKNTQGFHLSVGITPLCLFQTSVASLLLKKRKTIKQTNGDVQMLLQRDKPVSQDDEG